MGAIDVNLPWDAVVSKNRKYTVTRQGRMILSKQYRDGKKDIQKIASLLYQGPLIEGHVSIAFKVYAPDRRRRDILNLTQIICDGLEGVVYKNDTQIKRALVEAMEKDKDDPRVEVTVSAID